MQIPDLSRRSTIALVVVVAGLVAIALALFSGSGLAGGDNGGSPDNTRAIDPVAPLDPADKDAGSGVDPLDSIADPFANSYGADKAHKVTVRFSTGGAIQTGIRYRDGKGSKKGSVGGFSVTRTVKGPYPLALVGLQIGPESGYGTCEIIVDGVEVASNTTRKAYGITVCLG